MKKIKTLLTLTESENAVLDKVAANNNVSKSFIIGLLIRKYLSDKTRLTTNIQEGLNV